VLPGANETQRIPYGSSVADRLPELIHGPGALVLRRWVRVDAEILGEAVMESIEHLRPWMPWAADEPLSVVERRALIGEWERHWLAGGDVVMGIFVNGSAAGGCGLHHRIGPGGLEIGYWTRSSLLRCGIATSAARLLTEAAFARADITHVEIHHDKANAASAGIPAKLGFELIREVRDGRDAPSELGLSCEWQLTREHWDRLHPRPSPGA
jgi:ribosomal-protein-serine acetyltransferase